MRKFVFTVVIIAVAAIGFFLGQQSKSAASSEPAIIGDNKKPDLIQLIREQNVSSVVSWERDDKKFFGVTRGLNEPCEKDSILKSCEQFSIYDENNKVAYKLKDISIMFEGFNRFTPNASQIMLRQNGGGTDDFLTVIDYKDGKFTELPMSSETQLRGVYWTMPEYRTGADAPYFKPSQLIVIQQGGGSDPNPSAAVFRYRNNKFQKVGEIQMQELGDFIETQLNKKAK